MAATPPAALNVLCVPAVPQALASPAAAGWGPFLATACAALAEAGQALRERSPDALLVTLSSEAELAAFAGWGALSQAVLDSALVVVGPAGLAPATAVGWLQRGVQDVLSAPGDASAPDALPRTLRLAVERKRLEQAARKSLATDLSTGLPNHAQLHEHMTHLLALREREPAPMALIVLRVEGLARTAAALGAESANVLRRKAAVRLRAALRASDVVAALGGDAFAVLLAWIDSPADGQRVMDKLAASLRQPFGVTGRPQQLAVSAGLASYPEHGRDAAALLRRALAQASAQVLVGAGGAAAPAPVADRGPDAAAND